MERTPAELAALAGGRPIIIRFVRHAETEYNTQHRMQGWSDSAITELGTRQIAAVADRLAGETFDLVLCSDLPRTRTTAEGIVARMAQPRDVEYLEVLREWNFGGFETYHAHEIWGAVVAAHGLEFDAEGTALRNIADKIGWLGLFNEVAMLDATGEAEKGDAVVARAVAAVAYLVRAAAAVPGDGEVSVLVVSHGGFIQSMLRLLIPRASPEAVLPNCSVTTVSLTAGSDVWSLDAFGETSPVPI